MQQPMNTNPVQVVVLTQPGIIDKQSKYKNMKIGLARQLIGLGVVQVLIGILCIIFQGVSVWIYASGYVYSIDFIGHGFWNGLMFLITGSFGISGGIKRNRCQIITFNVLSIVSAAFIACLIGIAVPDAILFGIQPYCHYYGDYYTRNFCNKEELRLTGTAMQAMVAILGLIEGVIAIRSSVVCCSIGACCCDCGGSCCCPPAPLQNQFLMTGQPFAGQQIISTTQEQLASNQQPQLFFPNQQPTFLTNPQQSMFASNPQQAIIGLDPRQQVAQYNPQPPNPPFYNQPPSVYTPLSPVPTDQGSYTGLQTGMRNTLIYPGQGAIHEDDVQSPYAEIPDYNYIVNEEN